MNKKADVIRVYLPPDANTLLSVDRPLPAEPELRERDRRRQAARRRSGSTMDAAIKHCTAGIGIWEWASNDAGGDPDVVMACAGDVPTLETLAAVDLLRAHVPGAQDPRGQRRRPDEAAAADRAPARAVRPRFRRPLHHGQAHHLRLPRLPWLIHRLTYRRTNHANMHVRGYKEEGTTTTPFDMVVRNDLDRFHLVQDVIDRSPSSERGSRSSASTWPTSWFPTASTFALTVTTCPKSMAGSGRNRRRRRGRESANDDALLHHDGCPVDPHDGGVPHDDPILTSNARRGETRQDQETATRNA